MLFLDFLRITDSASWVITVLSGIIHNTSILLIIASSAAATSFSDAIFLVMSSKVVFFARGMASTTSFSVCIGS